MRLSEKVIPDEFYDLLGPVEWIVQFIHQGREKVNQCFPRHSRGSEIGEKFKLHPIGATPRLCPKKIFRGNSWGKCLCNG